MRKTVVSHSQQGYATIRYRYELFHLLHLFLDVIELGLIDHAALQLMAGLDKLPVLHTQSAL